MKFQFLGTAAAESWPALFCVCDHCKRAEAAGGRNIRTRSQALVDDKLLIDFPPDTYLHIMRSGLPLRDIHSCIITHSHSDHLYVDDLYMRKKKTFAQLKDDIPFTVYGSAPTVEMLRDIAEKGIIKTVQFSPFVPFEVEGYTIPPLLAAHDPATEPVIFLISDGKRTVLYGNDTGYFPEQTWDYFRESGVRLDLLSLDCTGGTLLQWRKNHMSLDVCAEVKQRLCEYGVVTDKTISVVHHFSHNGIATYDEMVPLAKEQGFLVSYDGMIVNL
ncbi:MAG: hypothetical protein GX303_03515 [Clostridiales bacterium]|nr:hypothetical protein [Clostridiales bacterium]